MFSMSLAFRKIARNAYAYTPGFVCVSKAYMVTAREKKLLTSILNKVMQAVLAISAAGTLPVLRSLFWGLLLYLFAYTCLYIYYKRETGKILAGRKKQACERQRYPDYLKRYANTYGLRYYLELCAATLVWMAILLHACFHYWHESRFMPLIPIGIVFVVLIWFMAVMIFCMYLKWRK